MSVCLLCTNACMSQPPSQPPHYPTNQPTHPQPPHEPSNHSTKKKQIHPPQAGARNMDEHFATAPARENIPVLLGLLGLWNSTFLGHEAR